MIRNKRALPYQVQGLEMKLFASGKYNADKQSFLLDNKLEAGKSYYVSMIQPGRLNSIVLKAFIIDFLPHQYGGELHTSKICREKYIESGNSSNEIAVFQLAFTVGSNDVGILSLTAISVSDIFSNQIIYIYEIPLLPKGSVN